MAVFICHIKRAGFLDIGSTAPYRNRQDNIISLLLITYICIYIYIYIYINTYYVPGTEHSLLLYRATVLDRSYYHHPISQMRKLRPRAFKLYSSKPLVKG